MSAPKIMEFFEHDFAPAGVAGPSSQPRTLDRKSHLDGRAR
jgi:hypothetical protein